MLTVEHYFYYKEQFEKAQFKKLNGKGGIEIWM